MNKKKIIRLTPAFLALVVLLSGCVRRTSSGEPYGFVYEHLAIPTQHLLTWLANLLGGSYGWSIIVITFVVRLILMPVMVNQSKKATIQQEKMATIKPKMQDIQRRQKEATTPEEKTAVSQEMMALYRDNGISMTGGIGCLPILIQMPIFAALYSAIQYSPELSSSYFLGINLGQRSLIFVALSFITYGLQGWLSTLGLPESQKKQMKSMMLISPLMIGGMTFVAPAGLGLYFFIGGIFACLQTLIINSMRPRIREKIQKELAQRQAETSQQVVKTVTATEMPTADITPEPNPGLEKEVSVKVDETPKNNNRRNAGKQNRSKD
ncbi:membrane protein insertase YidC [Ligilactobacillus ceti]|uniref:Membrane protein insertase YidC n=1 Tax=Ligilactobacillus ceti DSM 22408 TaxID=1122146 RepID=A0A0R2KI77_9LACO|nr:membrane protein insertase YidC [Ligilactobacillus ceti]KRN88907.1 60 kda inner membrane protein [Ligilactobacillus ceti DSM 22408]